MKIQEASEEIREGEIVFPSPKTSYMKKHSKDKKNRRLRAGKRHPCAYDMRFLHSCTLPCTWGILGAG